MEENQITAEFLQILGRQIKMLRVSKNMKQSDLAERAGLSRVLIGQLENGTANISVSGLVSIAKAFEMKLEITFTK
jgi:transcriptional regulator with XRE-family HTH domain